MEAHKKHYMLLISAVLVMLLIAGCGLILPKEAGIAEEPRAEDDSYADTDVEQQAAAASEQPAEQETETAGEAEDTGPPPLPTSGSLDLQMRHDLCPHLVTNFSCDKYDLRNCGYTTMLGKEGFYPNVLNCRDGKTEGQVFCLIQECMPITEENIVRAYGGTTAYAEYTYIKDKVEGGIILHYKLSKCGETELEFETQDKCRFYRSTSGLP
jgi:hypothetical protein